MKPIVNLAAFIVALHWLVPNRDVFAQNKDAAKTETIAVYTYADVADLTISASMVLLIKVKSAQPLGKAMISGVAPNRARHLITSDVISLIRGKSSVDPKIRYIVDLQKNARGSVDKGVGRQFVVFAAPAKAGTIQLVGPESQIPDSPEAQTMVRRIIAELVKPDAPPKLTGISSVFNTPGSLAGESETQIFLESDDGRSVSISISREADKAPKWQVAVGETVDDGTGPPRRNTLLWYRLACYLPAVLPDNLLEEKNPEARGQIVSDYALVMQALGPCKRLRA